MERIGQVIPGALAAILRKAPLNDDKVEFAWRLAVGPALAKVTTVHYRKGVLHVRARDAAWQREVERAAGVVRQRLDSILGAGIVASIEVSPHSVC